MGKTIAVKRHRPRRDPFETVLTWAALAVIIVVAYLVGRDDGIRNACTHRHPEPAAKGIAEALAGLKDSVNQPVATHVGV